MLSGSHGSATLLKASAMSHSDVSRDSSRIPDLVGRFVAGKYRVERLIGSGGMGTVWEGQHTTLGTRVAIKFIKPAFAENPEARARFEIEARAAAKLQTKHAVHVFDYGVSEDGLPYIVMEFLEGESLSETIMRRGVLTAAETANIIAQAARALEKAHASGVVHRDLKPDNIFLATNEEAAGDYAYTVKLVDFGIAKILDVPSKDDTRARAEAHRMGGPTREGTVIGTPNFMAPEQLTVGGAPGSLTDLWSLGACTFAALTGRIPFEGDVLGDIVLKVCAAPLPVPSKLNPRVPPGFDAWFARACARDVSRRFQTASELAEALNGVCGVNKVRVGTLEEDQVQYVLRPRSQPDNAAADDLPEPGSMSPKTAMLAGLVLGVALMIGVVGVVAYREKMKSDEDMAAASASAAAHAASATASGAAAKPDAGTKR
jgi:serine/threonine protein kinase